MDYEKERNLICEVGKILYDRGHVAANDGNLSIRVAENLALVTPSGISKGRLLPDILPLVDLDGNILEGKYSPSSETPMHLIVYKKRPDVNAVVHTHPAYATAFSLCRMDIRAPYLSDPVLCTKEFAMPATDEVPNSLLPYLADQNALLLANHGPITWGRNIWEAFDRMEGVEHMAKILFNARMLGTPVEFSEEEAERLKNQSSFYANLRKAIRRDF